MKRVHRKIKNKQTTVPHFFVGVGFEMIHNSISIDHKFVDLLKRALQGIKIFI